jgi:hypothetical protein
MKTPKIPLRAVCQELILVLFHASKNGNHALFLSNLDLLLEIFLPYIANEMIIRGCLAVLFELRNESDNLKFLEMTPRYLTLAMKICVTDEQIY